jgi:hypothetical protein
MSIRFCTWRAALSAAALAMVLAGCGGGGSDTTPAAANQQVTVAATRAGVSPFIAFVDLNLSNPGQAPAAVHWRIAPKPGSSSRPVDVRYAMDYLQRRGYADSTNGHLTIPVFGLYANHLNAVDLELQFSDGSVKSLAAQIQTAPYSDPNGVYDRPRIVKQRTASEALDFDFFYMRSSLGAPVIVDSDGQVRWTVPGTDISDRSLFHANGFVIGEAFTTGMRRLELDGTTRAFALQDPGITNFHHSIDPGKQGLLVELAANINGVSIPASILADVDPDTGAVFKQWNLDDILSRHMQARGDDPSSLVRPGVDWFHMNAATYDPRDDTLIVSSREDFVVKIDYASGDVVWILGDPTKYWHSFPSLAASSLALPAGDLYPIGQHSVSIRHDGTLLLFNDGAGSFNQPAGAPAGETRSYSTVSAYAIDVGSRSAHETWRFDYGQSIFSSVCSSAYEAGTGTSVLAAYSVADGATHARLVGLDPNRNVVFDFEYPTTGCNTSWSAKPIALEALDFH